MFKKGVNLIVLTITIMVMIILAGATIATFKDEGLVDKAQETGFKKDILYYKDELLIYINENRISSDVNKYVANEIKATTLREMQEIIPNFKENHVGLVKIANGELVLGDDIELKKNEEYLKWLTELEIKEAVVVEDFLTNHVEVGHYVEYEPDTEITSVKVAGKDSGYNVTAGLPSGTEQTISKREMKWRVLKNDGKNVTLISVEPLDSINFSGAQGWLNCAQILNNAYYELYSGSKGVARNISVEDINAITGFNGIDETQWKNYDMEGKRINLPVGIRKIGDLEIYAEDNNLGQYISQTNRYTPEEEKLLENYLMNSYTYIPTYDSLEYELLFLNEDLTAYLPNYWLASNSVSVNFKENCAKFNIRYVTLAKIEEATVYISSHSYQNQVFYARPIIRLNEDVSIEKGSGDGSKELPWKLKE